MDGRTGEIVFVLDRHHGRVLVGEEPCADLSGGSSSWQAVVGRSHSSGVGDDHKRRSLRCSGSAPSLLLVKDVTDASLPRQLAAARERSRSFSALLHNGPALIKLSNISCIKFLMSFTYKKSLLDGNVELQHVQKLPQNHSMAITCRCLYYRLSTNMDSMINTS